MNEENVEAFDDEPVEQGTIGVGMGGSCPVCRAPVDLGQEFCLECGSPIRFTPRQRSSQRGSTRSGTLAPTPQPKRSGFPWIPFLIVLALIGGGVAFALVDGGSSSSSSKKTESDEPSLPEITNSVPETTSTTQTVTLQDCDPAQPLDGTQPAVTPGSTTAQPAVTGDAASTGDPTGTSDPAAGEQIPSLAPNGSESAAGDAFADPSVPSTTSTDESGAETVTVDQDGNLCSPTSDGTTTTPGGTDTGTSTNPGTDTGASTNSGAGGTGTGATASGDWPSGTDGWTVIVAGYPTQERATQRAADLQEDGFSDGGVLFSSDFTSLCPGIYVVFSGVFTSEAKARSRMAELEKSNYAGMYAREIRASGPAAQGCTAAN